MTVQYWWAKKTFGKGLVQTTRQLAYNAQLKVTTAKYYIPSGRCIQAIDYENRKNDGTVSKFPDSLKREFKTKGGRKVYDGAGLDPDVSVEATTFSSAVIELVSSGFVFEYASRYCSEHPNPSSMKSFRLSESDYQKFVTWVAEQKFTYATELDQKADELIASAKREKYYDELQAQFSELKARIDQNKNTALIRNQPELMRILEQEIAFHYQLTKGQVEVMLDRDPEINQARIVLADAASYRKILSAN